MPRKDGSLTKMEKRDIRDAFGLIVSMVGTAVSIASVAMTLSPRSDPDGLELARDLDAYLDSQGVGGWGLMELHRALSDPGSIGYLIDAVGMVADGPQGRGILKRLEKRRESLL